MGIKACYEWGVFVQIWQNFMKKRRTRTTRWLFCFQTLAGSSLSEFPTNFSFKEKFFKLWAHGSNSGEKYICLLTYKLNVGSFHVERTYKVSKKTTATLISCSSNSLFAWRTRARWHADVLRVCARDRVCVQFVIGRWLLIYIRSLASPGFNSAIRALKALLPEAPLLCYGGMLEWNSVII